MDTRQESSQAAVPNAGQLLNPVLRALHSLGGSASISDIEKFVIDDEGISERQLAVLVNVRPKTVFSKNLAAARTLLREYGVLRLVKAGQWELSEKGKTCFRVSVADVYRRRRELKEQKAQFKRQEVSPDRQQETSVPSGSSPSMGASLKGESDPLGDEALKSQSGVHGHSHRAQDMGSTQDQSAEIMFLNTLENIIWSRKRSPMPGSYTASLFAAGTNRIAQKVGEEATEVIVAALGQEREQQVSELADLVVHTMILMAQLNISLGEINAELERRHRA